MFRGTCMHCQRAVIKESSSRNWGWRHVEPSDHEVTSVGEGYFVGKPTKASSEEILAEANSVIHGERAQSYGPAEESFARIGELWSVHLGVPVDAYDVAIMMTLMKCSRAKTDVKRDTFVDMAGYAALAERCAKQAGRI